jgi:hypothetical protein
MADGDFLVANRDGFALGGLAFAFIGVGAEFLSGDEASVDRLALVASLRAGCLLARFHPAGAFSHGLVATQFFAVDFAALGLAPVRGAHLIPHAGLVAHTFAKLILGTVFVVAVLRDAILKTGSETVLLLRLFFLDAGLRAVVDLLHLLACLLADTFFLLAHWAILLAGRQEAILDGAAALLALGETGLVVTTVGFTTQHASLTRLTCLQARSTFGSTFDASPREIVSTTCGLLGALWTLFAFVLIG